MTDCEKESADAAYRCGTAVFNYYPNVPFGDWDNERDRSYFKKIDESLRTTPDAFREGWESARDEHAGKPGSSGKSA